MAGTFKQPGHEAGSGTTWGSTRSFVYRRLVYSTKTIATIATIRAIEARQKLPQMSNSIKPMLGTGYTSFSFL
jgi:hypothetical protein